MKVIWAPSALLDVGRICDYIARDDSRAAIGVVRRVRTAMTRLRRFPRSGRIVPESDNPSIREVVVSPFRVIYRIAASEVRVVAVVHAARLLDPEKVP